MPLIECLIEREGPTTINDGGFKFVFEENEQGHKVCNVLSEGSTARLLNFTWFRKYRPDVDYKDDEDQSQPEDSKSDEVTHVPEDIATQGDHVSEKEIIDARIKMIKQENPEASLRVIGQAVGRSQTYVSKVLKG